MSANEQDTAPPDVRPSVPPHATANAPLTTARQRSGLPAIDTVEHLRLLADNMPALISYYSREGLRCLFANELYARSYGFDTHSIIGKKVEEVIGSEAFHIIQPYIQRAFALERVTYERTLTLPSGERRIIEGNLIPHVDASGAAIGAFVMLHDITKFRDTENAIRESEERFAKFADATNDGIVFFENGIITDVNDAILTMVRATREQTIGHSVLDFIAPESRETVANNIRAGLERAYEGTLLRLDGTTLATEISGRAVVRNGKKLRMTLVRDITARKRSQARIEFLAHHDPLTHLPNRVLLLERLGSVLATAQRLQSLVGVLFIDLDNFKTINDSLGHHAGDELLRNVANRLKSTLRSTDLIGRLGGDEFVIVLSTLASADDIAPTVEKINAAISEPFQIEGQIFSISGSIGISLYPQDGDTADTLIRNADAAMYLAKERGRSNFQFFVSGLHVAANDALALESGIRQAIKQQEFVLHYQPEIAAHGSAVASVEALIRWNHPALGMLLPGRFISVAEHRGLIIPIGRWVIGEAIRQARAWLDAGIRTRIAINISAIQFKQKDLVEDIANKLAEFGLPAELLELELTESLFLEDVAAMTRTLRRLKDLGVTLSVDDFGTGYSSLAYLKRYPIDKIKIDRSFVHDLPDDQDDVAITIAIIDLAKALSLQVIAEGVETEAQVKFLQDHQCDFIQGTLISPPLPAEEMAAWLQSRT